MTMNSSPGSQQLLSTSNFNALPVASNANSPDLKIADLISRKQTPSERPFLLWNRSQEELKDAIQLLFAMGFTIMGVFFSQRHSGERCSMSRSSFLMSTYFGQVYGFG